MLNRGNFFRTAMASPRFKGCATAPLNGLLRAEVEITKDMLVHIAVQMKQVPGIETVQQRPKKYKKSECIKRSKHYPRSGRGSPDPAQRTACPSLHRTIPAAPSLG
jgi:hypothetical protein